ncbi:MAG TPA: 6-bladed beta-propeller [Ignavibacteriales bacterium]|nr:6-bladed beta-propeller [Ignavibacteriales bacterium]
MKKKKHLLLLILSVLFIGVIVFYKVKQSKAVNVKITLRMVNQFGSPNDPAESLIGLISSFTIDQFRNVYILDDAFKVVRKFSSEGKFIRNFGYGSGKGPGELNFPHGVCVDSSLHVYVIDKSNRNITVFDSLNNLVGTVKVPFFPAQIIPISTMRVDVMGFLFSYRGDMFRRYDFLKEKPEIPELTYGERLTGRIAEMSIQTGNSGRLVKSPSGDIYYCFFNPYLIRKYSVDGKLLMSMYGERKLPAPHMDPKAGIVRSSAGVSEFVVLPHEILMTLVYEFDEDEEIQYFDFFNGKTGKFLGSVPCKELGLEKVRYMKTDDDGNIYLDIAEPYPHLNKYKLSMELK